MHDLIESSITSLVARSSNQLLAWPPPASDDDDDGPRLVFVRAWYRSISDGTMEMMEMVMEGWRDELQIPSQPQAMPATSADGRQANTLFTVT